MNAASKKILIADDDSSVRLVLSQAFTRPVSYTHLTLPTKRIV